MADSAISDLDPRLQPLAQQFLDLCIKAGLKVRITTTWRDPQAQQAAYDAGLSKAEPGHSPHECVDESGNPASKAFDWSCYDAKGDYIKNGEDQAYAISGHIVEQLGLTWGAAFPKPDWDHAQLKNWRSI